MNETTSQMKAAVYRGPKDVRIESVPRPVEPKSAELIVDVIRGAICGTDSGEFAHGPHMIPVEQEHPNSGHKVPIVLGHEFVGRITAVGEDVKDFEVGQRIVCGAGVSCGVCDWCQAGRTNLCERYFTLGLHADGGLAESVRVPAGICVLVPEDCTDDAAAMAQPLAVALHALNRGRADKEQTLVVIGVGGIGAFVVGGAQARGQGQTIAIDVAEDRLRTAGELGAEHIIDAREEDPVDTVKQLTDGEGAHVVIEASGTSQAPDDAIKMARRGGRVVIVGLQAAPTTVDLFDMTVREIEMSSALAHICAEDLPEAVDILTRTEISAKVVDRVIGLEQLVPDGLVALSEGRAHGKILVDTQ